MTMNLNRTPTLLNGKGGTLTIAAGAPKSLHPVADGKVIVSANKEIFRLNADGSLDSSYGTAGHIHPEVFAIAGSVLLAEGKLLVLAEHPLDSFADFNLRVFRYTADGIADSGFGGGDGVIDIDIPGKNHAVAIVVLADGKIMLAADTLDASGFKQPTLVRLLSDGRLDPAFSDDGVMILAERVELVDMAVQQDGKILMIQHDMLGQKLLVRYHSDGSIDTSFAGGKLTFAPDVSPNSIDVQADGRILVSGSASLFPHNVISGPFTIDSGIALMRFQADGTPDTAFGTNGRALAVINGFEQLAGDRSSGTIGAGTASMLVQPDGKILVGGHTSLYQGGRLDNLDYLSVVRFDPDGKLDTSFSGDGRYTIGFTDFPESRVQDMALRSDGALLLAGIAIDWGNTRPVQHTSIVALKPNGSLDSEFHAPLGSANAIEVLQGGSAVPLNSEITVLDPELAALADGAGNYSGALLTVARSGGASADDHFIGLGNLHFANGRASLSGLDIGSVQQQGGKLQLLFNANASQAVLDATLASIAYRFDGGAAPAAPVPIDWRFDDGQAAASPDAAFTTSVSVTPTTVPYWIDALLRTLYTLYGSHEALRSATLDKLGENRTVQLVFPESTTYTDSQNRPMRQVAEAEQTFMWKVVDYVSTVLNLQFVPGSSAGADAIHVTAFSDGFGGGVGMAADNDRAAQVLLGFTGAGAYQARTPLHELGHVLGLKHAFSEGYKLGFALPDDEANYDWTLMAYKAGRSVLDEHAIAYRELDIAALQWLYGPSLSSRTGNDTYHLSETAPNFIWDGAGTDTVSAAGITRDLTLHLAPGHWDHVGDVGRLITSPGQITINFGSVIENAIGGAGNDSLTGNAADNLLDGGAGIDIATYAGSRSDYTLRYTGGGFEVSDLRGQDGTDMLINIEHLQFGSTTLALDIDGSAGKVLLLFQAAFKRIPDQAGLGYWLSKLDGGLSLADMVDYLMADTEFTGLYGKQPSAQSFLTQLYRNSLHREPDPAGLAWWTATLEQGLVSHAEALTSFSFNAEQRAWLVGQFEAGVAYTPWPLG